MARSHRPRVVFSSALASLGLGWALASGVTCANGNGSVGGGSATSSTTSSTTVTASSSTSSSSAGGGGGGSTSASSSASTSTSSSTSATGTGGAGGGSTSSSSGVLGEQPNIVSIYAEGNALEGNSYDVPGMLAGPSTPFDDNSVDAIGLAFTGEGVAVAVARSQTLPDAGTNGELHFALWNGSWTPGFGGVWPAVQPGVYINGGPSIAGSAQKAHCAFQGTDMSYYYAELSNGAWFPTDQAITVGGVPSTGPAPPAITTLSNDPIIAYVGNDADLHDQELLNSVWQPQHAHGVTGAASTTPAIVALTQGPELLVVFTRAAGQQLMFTTRTSGTWSTPAMIPAGLSGDQVSLAPLAAGGAVLVWRGTDTLLYTSLFSAGPPAAWSVPVTGIMGSVSSLQTPPAVATGAIGAQAELLYLDSSDFLVYSSRMTNGAWEAPAMAGAAQYHLAVATGN
jgi:hypothetical protein